MCGDAEAETRSPPEPPSAAKQDETRPDRFLFFAGFDHWRSAGTLYGGMMWSPAGLIREGPVLKLFYAGGFYRYDAGTARVMGAHDTVAILPGWHFVRGGLDVTVYGGADLQYHRTSPYDPGNRLNGGHAGLRIGADLWWQPRKHWMVTSSLSASTVGNSYGVRLAGGRHLWERLWIGPEIEASGDRIYRQLRVGMHVTALRFWFGEWTVSTGYVRDSGRRDGVYGRLGLLVRR